MGSGVGDCIEKKNVFGCFARNKSYDVFWKIFSVVDVVYYS